ncbi:DUF4286 family protein [Parabacteroides sp. PF5-9]|uniref:DUF4286 family protein n=1 Tax=Parabacteroides sp. PF5-9 TaxID=1742404 RepID=UPI002474B72D|nr:DUF4286 family protein [Parabacteroides sp. PF5-9]
MIVYNTTFHIDKDILQESLNYLKKEYIPQAIVSGFLQNPCLRRIMHASDDGGESYSVQFHVKNVETLNDWIKQEGALLQKRLVQQFGNKMTGFTTLLEEINLGHE